MPVVLCFVALMCQVNVAAAQSQSLFSGPALHRALATVEGRTLQSPADEWQRVRRLPVGSTVTVSATGRSAVSGQFMSADVEGITVVPLGSSTPLTIRRDAVVEVIARVPHRGSKLGAVVGVGAGALVGFMSAVSLSDRDCGGNCADEKFLIGASLIGIPVAGGLIGYYAFHGRPKVETVYRR